MKTQRSIYAVKCANDFFDMKTTNIAKFESAWKNVFKEEVELQTPPQGAVSAYEFSRLNGITRDKASAQLRRLENAGKLKSALYRTKQGSKTLMTRYWVISH